MATSAHADANNSFLGDNDGFGENGQSFGFQFNFGNPGQSQFSSCTSCQNFFDNDNNGGSRSFFFGNNGSGGTQNWGGNSSSGSQTVAVPEPSSVALTFAGGTMLALFAFFRRKPIAGNSPT